MSSGQFSISASVSPAASVCKPHPTISEAKADGILTHSYAEGERSPLASMSRARSRHAAHGLSRGRKRTKCKRKFLPQPRAYGREASSDRYAGRSWPSVTSNDNIAWIGANRHSDTDPQTVDIERISGPPVTPPAAEWSAAAHDRTASVSAGSSAGADAPLQAIDLGTQLARFAPAQAWRRAATCPAASRRRRRRSRRRRSGAPGISANSGSASAKAGWVWSNGSNETTTVWRFATAKVTRTIASGTRISTVTILRIAPVPAHATGRTIEPLAHFLAGLEERHGLSSPPRRARRCADCVRCAPAGS